MTTPDTLTIRVNAHQFASAIRYVALAAAKDDGRPVLAGINLRIAGGLLDVAAADGFRLHVAYVQLPSFTTNLPAPDAPRNVLIDAQALLAWAKTVKTPKKAGSTYAPTYATLYLSADRASIDGTDLERTISGGTGRYKVADRIAPAVIDGTFPDYRHIIPATDEAHRFRFNAAYLRDAAKPYLRGKRDEKKLGTARTILYTSPDGFPHVGAAGFEMPSADEGNGKTTSFAHVARFGPGTAASVLTLATVLNTNYLHDALTGVDHGATFQTASTNTAVRLDLWQTQYAYSTQLCAVIMPLVIGDYGVTPSAHRDLNAPDAPESPVSDETAAQDAAPMPAPEHATVARTLHAQSRPRIVTVCDECGTEVDDTNASVDALLCIACHTARERTACADCGASRDGNESPDSHLCAKCYGIECERNEREAAATNAPAAQCPVCGTALETGDRFCPMCGARIDLQAAAQERQVSATNPPREHRCKTCIATNHTGELCAACDALERTIARRAERAATLAAVVAPDPEPADVLPYSGAADLSAKYSQGNVLRILAACPTATDTRGFHQWQEAGRAVKKGEKGIIIYTPAGTRTDKDGNERTMVRKAYVWDVSQTEPIEAFRARQDAKKAGKDAPVPCADCGNPDADGRCSACAYVRKATKPAIARGAGITPANVYQQFVTGPMTPTPAAPQPQPAMRAADI